MNRFILTFFLWSSTLACVSSPEKSTTVPPSCSSLERSLDWSDQISVLDKIRQLFDAECYEASIRIGEKARSKFQHKEYSLLKESAEIFLAEGTVTDYVLESYERGYLSFLITLSYFRLGQTQELTPALNRFYNEERALLYNYGQDPVNSLLQAVMWENFPVEGYAARPLWLSLSQAPEASAEAKEFAEKRIKDIDAGARQGAWQIYAVGTFPGVDWTLKFSDSTHGYIEVKPVPRFPESCQGKEEIFLPSKSWFSKIAIRHSNNYHPLVNAKSWIRLPVGIAYGITTAAAGASLMVGGCALDVGAKADGHLCKVSLQGGAVLMAKSDDVVEAALKPDLRHWQRLPLGFYVTRNALGSGERGCQDKVQALGARRLI